ncbi:MAG: proline dehydrogenase family protein [Chloroflexota bacterium]
MMRKLLLWASTNAWLRERAMRTRFVRLSVRKFMPGEQVEDAITAAVQLQPSGVNAIFTKLGENITHLAEADDVYAHYLKVLELIKSAGISGEISIKPTQLGYDQDQEVCFDYCMKILKACEAQGTIFWIDMEGSAYTQGTITLFKRLRAHSTKVGIAIQAYLLSTDRDLEELATLGATIRMVKGAYLEPASVAFAEKSKVNEQYYKNCVRLLQPDADKSGALLHIATHDVGIQDQILAYVAQHGIEKRRYEFAMLYGINTPRQLNLAQRGERVRCLVAYGEYWFPWYMRRLAERPANIGFVLRNAFKR